MNRQGRRIASATCAQTVLAGERLKGDLARVVVAAHLEMVEHSGASEQIEADAEPLGETNRDGDPDIDDLVGKIHPCP